MSLSSTNNMESKACSQLFVLVKDYLTKLSYCGRFLDDLSIGEDENIDFLTTSFSLFRELGRLGEVPTIQLEEVIPKFKEALENNKHKKFNFQEIFNKPYSGEREGVDEVNYIYVGVLNSYGLNLKTSKVSDIQSQYGAAAIEVEVAPQTQVESGSKFRSSFLGGKSKPRSKQGTGLSIYRNIFRTNKLGEMDETESFEYIVSKTQALERLEREIRSGRVYIYLSKPLRNPVLKRYFSYLCLVGLGFSGISFLIAFISALSNSNQESSGGGQSKGHPSLFAVMSFIFFLLSGRENNRGLENENFKYCFSRKIFFYYFFLSSGFILSATGGTSTDGGYGSLFQGKETGQIVFFAFLVAVVILSVTFFLVGYFFLNPKKNKALIESLINKYSNPPYFNN